MDWKLVELLSGIAFACTVIAWCLILDARVRRIEKLLGDLLNEDDEDE